MEQDGTRLLSPDDWHLGGRGAILLPGLGPPEMPSWLLARIMEQLAPDAVVSSAAHRLLPCPAFGRMGVRCWPADPSGFAEVAAAAVGMADRMPVLLAHDLNGQQAQALVHSLEAANCTAQLFFTSLCLPGSTDGDDSASLAAFAIRQWGTRIVQRADEVAPLGRRLYTTSGHRATQCMPLALL